jgi:putative membrane protein
MMDGGGSMFFGGGFMWIFWVLVLVAIVVVARAMMPTNAPRSGAHEDSALSILDKRYARGEIGREEYHEKKRELEG